MSGDRERDGRAEGDGSPAGHREERDERETSGDDVTRAGRETNGDDVTRDETGMRPDTGANDAEPAEDGAISREQRVGEADYFPFVAGALSLLLPGAGQYYAGDSRGDPDLIKRGRYWLGVEVAAWAVLIIGTVVGSLLSATGIGAIVGAPMLLVVGGVGAVLPFFHAGAAIDAVLQVK